MKTVAIVSGFWALNTLGMVLAMIGISTQTTPLSMLGGVVVGCCGMTGGFLLADLYR